jgi:hypothetical protein
VCSCRLLASMTHSSRMTTSRELLDTLCADMLAV